MKNNGDIIHFIKQRDYKMVNNELGKGSFGKTVVLQDPFIDELFVAKKYEPEFDDKDMRERFFKNFLDEIKILYKLNHKNIVRIFNYYAYEKDSTGFIIMEYIDGINIGKCISEYGPFSDYSLDNVFIQLIDGFNYIETHGIIHRDIREQNILIDKAGIVKIIDFGIGKVIEKGSAKSDSLASKINRAASDTLPQEYYEGVYTSKTDMFYLGELFHRLMSDSWLVDESDFSHHGILEKMMAKNPDDRYSSFAEIKEAVDKQDFINMNISQSDKEIYLSFANHLYNSLAHFIDERKFDRDAGRFILKIEQILKDNCFENEVQSNSTLLRSIITGGFSYNPHKLIYCENVKVFLQWYKKATPQSQQLILNNLISKLSLVDVKASLDDIPF